MEQKLNEIYGKIANTINEIIPEDWDKVYMYGEIGEEVRESYFYYYPTGNNKPICSHDIPQIFNVSEDEYRKLLYKLVCEITELWNEFKNNEQEPWTNLTFILESNGKFKIDYEYTDLSEASPRKQRWIWKYKYLGIMPENEKGRKVIDEYIKSTQNK